MPTPITRYELRASIELQTVVVVDALPAEPYRQRHLPGALNLTAEDADAHAGDVLPDRGAAVVTYSTNAGCARGQALAERLEALGYRDVRVYRDGIDDWAAAGLPVSQQPVEGPLTPQRHR